MKRMCVAIVVAGTLLAITGCGSASSVSTSSAPASSSSSPASSGTSSGKTLTIGYSYAASGGFAAFELGVLHGAQFAVNQINAGNYPVKLKLVAEDNGGTTEQALQVTQSMLSQGIRAFMMSTINANVAMGQRMAKAGAVIDMGLVSPPTVRIAIGPRAFSLAEANVNVQAAAMAKYACSKGYKTVYTLSSSDLGYTNVAAPYFVNAFAHDCGGKSVGSDTWRIGALNYSEQVAKIRSTPGVDAIFSPMFPPDTIAFLKQLRSAGVTVPFLGSDGMDEPVVTQGGNPAVDGVVYATTAFDSPGSPLAKFFAQFKATTGRNPTSNEYEAVGRDNMYAYLAALQNDHWDTSPNALITGFKAIKNLPLVTGTTSMGPNNVAIKPVAVVQIKGGKPTLLSFNVPTYVPAP